MSGAGAGLRFVWNGWLLSLEAGDADGVIVGRTYPEKIGKGIQWQNFITGELGYGADKSESKSAVEKSVRSALARGIEDRGEGE